MGKKLYKRRISIRILCLCYKAILQGKFNTPLQLDFIVWSKMQKIMAAESFIKTFKDDDKENKEAINSEEQEPYDILNLKTTLENRLSEIRPLICK